MVKVSAERFPAQRAPLAFAMWDFSWLERRRQDGGYADWERALDELCERGYDAVRIDAYPHIISAGLERVTLEPIWSVHDWGSSEPTTVSPMPALVEFIAQCAQRGLQVGLSTWFRKDAADTRRLIHTPEDHAQVWIKTVAQLRAAGVLGAICYVDLCNEFPGELWAPFFDNSPHSSWNSMTPQALAWMETAVRAFREHEPLIPVTVSLVGFDARVREQWAFMDFLEPHIWMAQSSDFLERIGGNYNNFDYSGYTALAAGAQSLFRAERRHWEELLRKRILGWANISCDCKRPLVTTECWAVVNYRDWPGLDWGWVKELCEYGVEEALRTGRWAGLATSNFCGPQFAGMWGDISWHQRLTKKIRSSTVRPF